MKTYKFFRFTLLETFYLKKGDLDHMKHITVFTAAILVVIASSCSNLSRNNPDIGRTTGYNDSGELLPYPKSELISGFSIDTARLSIGHGDNWAITWADDDKQYSFFTDGKGFGTFEEDVSIAPVVLEGDPPRVSGKDILSRSGTLSYEGGDVNSAKVCGLLMVRGTLFAWVRNINPPGMPKGTGSKLMFSKDHARTWEWVDWDWPAIGYPTWLNAGKNYADARDDYAYFISPDGPSAYFDYDSMLMARVPVAGILDKKQYTFYGGLDENGEARWLAYEDRQAVFRHDGGCFRPDIVYNPGLKRYFVSIATPAKDWGWWSEDHPGRLAHFGLFEAPDPWGPWETVFFEEDWGAPENRFSPHIPPKWISEDGRTFQILYSCIPVGPYRFNIQKCTITV
ncbi:MAG: DUF4185 domain-containing protein [Bacteroidetes bacterium]|nr:DUF4185 domain-containing protein [Bacteroidota bacterium]